MNVLLYRTNKLSTFHDTLTSIIQGTPNTIIYQHDYARFRPKDLQKHQSNLIN